MKAPSPHPTSKTRARRSGIKGIMSRRSLLKYSLGFFTVYHSVKYVGLSRATFWLLNHLFIRHSPIDFAPAQTTKHFSSLAPSDRSGGGRGYEPFAYAWRDEHPCRKRAPSAH